MRHVSDGARVVGNGPQMALRRRPSSPPPSCQFHEDGRAGCLASAAYEASIPWGDGHYQRAVCLTHTDALPSVVTWSRLDGSAPKDLIRLLVSPLSQVARPPPAGSPLGPPVPAVLTPGAPAPQANATGPAARVGLPHPRPQFRARVSALASSLPRSRPLQLSGIAGLPRARLRIRSVSGPGLFRAGVAFFAASMIFVSAVVLMDARTGSVNAGEPEQTPVQTTDIVTP